MTKHWHFLHREVGPHRCSSRAGLLGLTTAMGPWWPKLLSSWVLCREEEGGGWGRFPFLLVASLAYRSQRKPWCLGRGHVMVSVTALVGSECHSQLQWDDMSGGSVLLCDGLAIRMFCSLYSSSVVTMRVTNKPFRGSRSVSTPQWPSGACFLLGKSPQPLKKLG